MSVTLKVKDDHAQVDVKGECTVAQAVELKETLVAALEKARKITLDFSDVTSTDVSVFQLICAAHRNAQSVGADMDLSALPKAMVSAIEELGFHRHMPCAYDTSGRCLFCLTERKKGSK